jgi:hypothetical protein
LRFTPPEATNRELLWLAFPVDQKTVKAFTSEINIHVPGIDMTRSVLASPKLLVCLGCGLADVLLSEDELQNLRETYVSVSREILADMNLSPPPKSSLQDQ